MPSQTPAYDIVMMTDCRFPGGAAASVVEEIIAQTRAGYRTALIHFPASVLTYPRPFNPKIRRCIEQGLVDLLLDVSEVRARLLLMRHPGIFTTIPAHAPRIVAEEKVLAVNQVPEDERGEGRHYDVHAVAGNLESFLGEGVRWAPIGPRVRESLEPYAGVVPVTDGDWENIVDVAAWAVRRTGFVSDRPVLGRHSRGHWTKWPADPEAVRAAWPDRHDYIVKVLGGTRAPERLLGGLPPNWISYPFDSIAPREFLAEIDFLVYYHHPGLIEAFGRVVLEGLAAGAVPVVDPYFRILFEDTCLYGTPYDVRDNIAAVYDDWEAYADLSRRGVELARRRYSYDTHVRRVRELIGEPSTPAPAGAPQAGKTEKPRPHGPLVLLVDTTPEAAATDGLVPLTRHAAAGTRLLSLTAPDGVAAARRTGAATEVLPARSDLDVDEAAWATVLSSRLAKLLDAHNPRTVAFAGPELPPRFATFAKRRSETRFVWLGPDAGPHPDRQVRELDLYIDASALETAAADAAQQTMATIESATDTAMRDLATALSWVDLDPQPRPRPQPRPQPPPQAEPQEPPPGGLRSVRHGLGERLPRLRWYVWRARTYRRRARRQLQRRQAAVARTTRRRIERTRRRLRSRAPEPETPLRLAVPPGRAVRLRDVADAPAVMIVLWNAAEADLSAFVERVALVQQITSEFRPLFVITGATGAGEADATAAFRRYGYLVEQILSEDDWARIHGATGWDDYAHKRLVDLSATYQPGHTVMIDGSEVEQLDLRRLMQLLRPAQGRLDPAAALQQAEG